MAEYKTKNLLAFDFGAESGRAMLGRFDGEKISLEEIHRFPNEAVNMIGTLYWDLPRLFLELKKGLLVALKMTSSDLDGIGIDTWGVDFGFIDRDGRILGNPVHYRDKRTKGILQKASEIVPIEEIFYSTGSQTMEINSIYQLLSMVFNKSDLLKIADKFLMIPDLFNYLLTGEKFSEYTVASTSQMLNQVERKWSISMLERFGVPAAIFPELIEPANIIGPLSNEVSEEVGAKKISVIAPACHDTASAIAAVPAIFEKDSWAFLSSGTWSIMGVEVHEPLVNKLVIDSGFANEGGIFNTSRLLKNINALWILQECRREWEKVDLRSITYDEINRIIEQAEPFSGFIDPDESTFIAGGRMEERILTYLKNTGQVINPARGRIARIILESIAMKYRYNFDILKHLLDRDIKVLHIVGGGAKNRLLCQFTSNVLGIDVYVGPFEATAIGNLTMQLVALKYINTIQEARQMIADSFEISRFSPLDVDQWEEQYRRFKKVTGLE